MHGHVAEPSVLRAEALDSVDEAVLPPLPQGHGHGSANTQLERDVVTASGSSGANRSRITPFTFALTVTTRVGRHMCWLCSEVVRAWARRWLAGCLGSV